MRWLIPVAILALAVGGAALATAVHPRAPAAMVQVPTAQPATVQATTPVRLEKELGRADAPVVVEEWGDFQ